MDKKNDKQSEESDQSNQSEEKVVDWEDVAKRAMADLDNFKKDAERQQVLLQQFMKGVIISNFVPVLNDLKRAISFVQSPAEKEGLLAVEKKIADFFNSEGFSIIDPEKGTEFDPEIAEAVAYEDSDVGEGKIIETVEVGLRNPLKVVHPAKVRVGK